MAVTTTTAATQATFPSSSVLYRTVRIPSFWGRCSLLLCSAAIHCGCIIYTCRYCNTRTIPCFCLLLFLNVTMKRIIKRKRYCVIRFISPAAASSSSSSSLSSSTPLQHTCFHHRPHSHAMSQMGACWPFLVQKYLVNDQDCRRHCRYLCWVARLCQPCGRTHSR